MCRRIDCRTCGRPTFAGCGMHIEQVLADVPPGQRCKCRETRETRKPEPKTPRRGWLKRLLG